MSYFKHIKQDVVVDANNSSVANLVLANAYTFTGVGSSTLGVVGLQWSLKTDKNATVYIEESPDNINWDISYVFDYISSKGGRGETVQATQSYWRIRVVLTVLENTSYFRLSGVLCPIAVPLPSYLSADGRLKSESTLAGRENTSRHVWVNPTNELAISPVYRLVGTAFDGIVLDPNFWTPALVNGTITQGGGAVHLQTSAAINSSAIYASKRRGRFVAGSAMLWAGGFNWEDAAVAGNTRRCGPYSIPAVGVPGNGYFFEYAGIVFNLGTRKAGVDTLIPSGTFNGNLGSSWKPVAGSHYLLQIEYTPLAAIWYVNGARLHAQQQAHLSDTQTLPITIENLNTTNNTDIGFESDGVYIARQGELITNPISHVAVGVSVSVLKYGAGVIRGIVLSAITNTAVVNIYDGVAITGTLIWSSGPLPNKQEPIPIEFFSLPFSLGLVVQVIAAAATVLTVYE